MEKFNYEWKMKDSIFTKDKGTVFSCFACGGGSSMGYKLAGFDVIGCNEIDPRMNDIYVANHNPKINLLMDIRDMVAKAKLHDLPKELYQLDILDGSPPCSSFSIAGKRERVFFLSLRKNLADEFLINRGLFEVCPYIDMTFNGQPIAFCNVKDGKGRLLPPKMIEIWKKKKIWGCFYDECLL